MAMRQMKLRLSDEDYALLGRLADEAGISMAAFARESIRLRAAEPTGLRDFLVRARDDIGYALRLLK